MVLYPYKFIFDFTFSYKIFPYKLNKWSTSEKKYVNNNINDKSMPISSQNSDHITSKLFYDIPIFYTI